MNNDFIVNLLLNKFNGRKTLTIFELFDVFPELSDEETNELYRILYINKFEIIEESNSIVNSDEEFPLTLTPQYDSEKYDNIPNETLVLMYQKGDTNALSRIFENNKKFIWSLALKQMRIHRPNLDVEDLFQFGCLGLIEAVNRFNYDYKYKFLTFAYFWIYQKISRAIYDEGNLIRLPVHMRERINKIDIIIKNNNLELINNDAIMFIAKELNNDYEEILKILEIKNTYLRPRSLDVPISEDGDSVLIDFIESNESNNPENVFFKISMHDDINNLLNKLKSKERRILQYRFGLIDGRCRTLEEIGNDFGVTRERIRQIEAKALKKLSKMNESKILKESYIGE